MIIRTYLDPDKMDRDDEYLEVVQIDTNPPTPNTLPKPEKSDIQDYPGKDRIWYSARDLRKAYDEREDRHCGMC